MAVASAGKYIFCEVYLIGTLEAAFSPITQDVLAAWPTLTSATDPDGTQCPPSHNAASHLE